MTPSPRNHGETFKFHVLYKDLFDPLTENLKKPTGAQVARGRKAGPHGLPNLTPHERRKEIINRFFSRWRLEVGDNIYPALRLILPAKDRDRAMYGLKEKALAKILVKLIKIDKNSEDAYNLVNWKRPGQSSEYAGDFAGRVYEVLSKRALRIDPGDLTIEQVNDMLGKLSVESKEDGQTRILEQFYQQMNAEEMMWLIRIILRNMRVGATEKTFLDIWHPDAEALFNVCSSLRRVCQELYKREIRLQKEDMGVSLMACYQPQLAFFNERKQSSFTSMVTSMKMTEDDQEFWIEEKLDGERMQLHMMQVENTEEDGMVGVEEAKKVFKFWSRKAKDYTYLYGSNLDDPNGSLTRHLKDAFLDGVENIILDGEMITWDPDLDVMVPFGTLKTAALAENKDPFAGGVRPFYRVFDILYLNSTDLTRYTLRDRRRALEASIKPVHRRLEILEYSIGRTAEDIESRLQRVIENASEGLVLKNPRSSYQLNERRDDWVKVKPEYMNEFGESLDCVIVGGYYGSGHRGGVLGSYLCGLRDDWSGKSGNGSASEPLGFLSFFKVGGGMTREEYKAIQHQTEGKWHDWDPKRPPSDVIKLAGGPRQLERPDKWIHPSESLVVEVKAASVNPTEDYATGLTLRFPRFVRFRPDKDWKTALSLQEFRNLKETVEEQHKQNVQKAVLEAARRRPVKGQSSRAKKPLTVAGYNARAINNVPRISDEEKGDIFQGLTLFVMTESSFPPKKSKLELEELIRANGGRIVQSPDIKSEDRRTDVPVVCIAERRAVKVASLMKRGLHEIIKPIWVYDCVRQAKADFAKGLNRLTLPYEPSRHLFFTPVEKKELLEFNADKYGDSYARDITMEELQDIMTRMGQVDSVSHEQQVEGEELLHTDPEDSRGNMFATLRMYFHVIGGSTVTATTTTATTTSKDLAKTAGASSDQSNLEAISTAIQQKALFGQASIATDLSDQSITHVVLVLDLDKKSNGGNTHEKGERTERKRERERKIEEIAELRKTILSQRRYDNNAQVGVSVSVSEDEGRRRNNQQDSHSRIPRIISSDWIKQCWEEGTRIDEERFTPFFPLSTD